jgi:ADP-heptose:LPS heptosyltransferase
MRTIERSSYVHEPDRAGNGTSPTPRPLPRPGRGIVVISERESLGDGFYKLYLLRALKRSYPEERITWVVSESDSPYRNVMARIVAPYVSSVVPNAGLQDPKLSAISNLRALPPCSLAIDNRSLCSVVLKTRMFLRADLYQAPAAGYMFSSRRPRGLRPRHKLARLMAMLQAVTRCPVDGSGEIPLPPAAIREAEAALPDGPTYVGIAPGATGPSHRWPLDRFIELARWIEERGWRPVVFLGPLERAVLPEIRRSLPRALFPGCTETETLREVELSLALAHRVRAAAVNDTGIGHLMAAAGTPLLSLFGPTDPRRWSPVGKQVRVIWSRDYGGREVDRIPFDAVTAALARLVSANLGSAQPATHDHRAHALR